MQKPAGRNSAIPRTIPPVHDAIGLSESVIGSPGHR